MTARIPIHALVKGDRFVGGGELHEVAAVRYGTNHAVVSCVSGRTFAAKPDAMLKGVAAPRPDTWDEDS